MRKFEVHTGVAAPLLRSNVDTDAIIPSREMKSV
jgi:3-isopropylmalate/(R)-2-methylmalate dehydratase small subunit